MHLSSRRVVVLEYTGYHSPMSGPSVRPITPFMISTLLFLVLQVLIVGGAINYLLVFFNTPGKIQQETMDIGR
jgi:hypothetical protein